MEFWELNRLGFLPKDEIFSIFNQRHRREVIALFKIFYYAKDYTTLYKTACWARLFMNEGLFVYSLSVALVQRSDTAMIDLPPIYEIYPEYFYNSDVIRETQKARQLYKDRPRTPVEPIQDPHSTETYPNPTEYGTTVETPAERSIDEKLNGQPNQPQPSYPPWYAFLPETLHPMWMNPQYRMGPDAMTEQLAQAQIMQEQLRSKLSSKLEDQDGIDPNTFNGITIDANYSRQGGDVNRELILSYFTEDVGLSAYYYYYNIYYPFWLPNELINFETDRRGEQFYYMIQQLLARYYLERLSNGLGDVAILDYMMPIRTGYYPLMSYPNGRKFPVRPDKLWLRMERAMENTRFDNNYTNSYAFVRDYERRIKDAIDLGYVTTVSIYFFIFSYPLTTIFSKSTGKQIYLYDESGFETLGNMIEGNMESPNGRFYGSLQIFARMLLGNVQPLLEQQEYVIVPSVLEHFETSLRDPVFYQFFKRMLMHFQRYLNNVPPYSTKELLMPGVKIEDVEIDERLTTYFENYYVDISNAVYSKNIGHDVRRIPVRVRQMRLNHEPFRYTMNINSDKAYAGLVKVFIGPKYDEIGRRLEITESRLDFVEIDKFPVSLTPGMNNIRRSSSENFYSRDRTSYREMYKRIMLAISTPSFSKYEPRDPEWSMPQR